MKRILILLTLLVAVCAVQADRRALLLARNASGSTTPSATTNNFNGTSVSINLPSGIAVGGVLLVTSITDTSADVTNTSLAMLPVNTNTLGQSGFNAMVRATDGTETTLTIDFGSTEAGVVIASYFPNCTTNLADGVFTATSAPGAGVAMTSASITTSSSGCYVVSVFFVDPAGSPTFTNVAPYLVLSEAVRGTSGAAAMTYVTQTSAGAQTQQIISDTGGTWGTFSISFKP